MYKYLHVKYPLFLSDVNETWFVLNNVENPEIYLIKIRPVEAELFHAKVRTADRPGGQTDRQADRQKDR
jgi:hypothetical protein